MKVGILSTSIATVDGSYTLRTINIKEALDLVNGVELDSAIGHAATAEVLTRLLGVDIPVNRQEFAQQVGQKALVFKLLGRIPEGVVLSSLEEIEAVGYVLKLLTRTV